MIVQNKQNIVPFFTLNVHFTLYLLQILLIYCIMLMLTVTMSKFRLDTYT